MQNIIKADFFRFIKSKVWLKIILGLSIFLVIGNIYALVGGGHGTITVVSDVKNQNAVSFYPNGSAIMPSLLRGSNLLFYCLLPIVLHTLVSDFKWGTLKNELSFRYSRTEFYLSKFVFGSLLAIALPMVYVLYGLLLNQLFRGFSGTFQLNDFIEVLKIVALQAPVYIGFIGIFLLIGVIFQSNSVLVSVVLTYQMAIFFIIALINNFTFMGRIEPITCLNSAAFVQQLPLNDILTIIAVGLLMTAFSLILGILVFNRKAIQ